MCFFKYDIRNRELSVLMLSFIKMIKIYKKGEIPFLNDQTLKLIKPERQSIDEAGIGSMV